MADQPDSASILEAAYVAETNRARRTVAATFDLDELPISVLPGDVQLRYRVVWRIRLDEAMLPISHLLLAIPLTFPDELPDVYLPEEITREGVRIPHLDRQRQLCTYDDTARHPNAERAGEAACEVIQRAVQLVCDGLSGVNTGDYANEFEAYWLDGARKSGAGLADVCSEGSHRRIVSVQLSPPLGPYTRLFAESEGAAGAFLEAIGRNPSKLETVPALYLHLGDLVEPPNLVTNADVYRYVSIDPIARDALLAFLSNSKRPSTVLFSIPAQGERVFAAWVHPRYWTDIYSGKKKSRRVMDQVPGFPPGHLPAKVELTSSTCAGLVVSRIIVRRADDTRLASRTTGHTAETAGGVTIIGCGSVGGFVADTVRHVRPSLLRLVDPQDLEVHNVPRHFCDMAAVGINKAQAVRAALRRFDPHLQVEAYSRDVLGLLLSDTGSITPAKQTFVAVANIAVERRLNSLSRQLDLGTVVYLWIEPHAIAGHAIVVPPTARGCFECLLDSSVQMTVRVLQNPGQFERADAGCRGSYLPYSGLDVQTFALSITRAALTCAGGAEGTIVTWIGDIDRARREGWSIQSEWANSTAFSISTRPISARSDCPICGRPE